MKRNSFALTASVGAVLTAFAPAWAGQVPGAALDPDIPISHRDRVYSAEQFSNTVSVTDPVDNKLLGVIRLGDPLPASFSPLYKGQLLVHGMGFSPDHRTIAVVAIGSNAVNFIDTATNSVKHISYVGRSPHEAFFTPDGKEVWVVVRGENYVAVLDGTTYEEKGRIVVANGPGMTIFSPDGKYGYVCSSFTPETAVIGEPGRPGPAGARLRAECYSRGKRGRQRGNDNDAGRARPGWKRESATTRACRPVDATVALSIGPH
jgi:hypothetical protein